MLRRLGRGVRPDGSSAVGPRAAVDRAGFEDLLERARTGALGGRREVRVDRSSGVELDAGQLERVGVVADAAEAAGAARVLVVVDGEAVVVETGSRSVVAGGRELKGVLDVEVDAAAVAPERAEGVRVAAGGAPGDPAESVATERMLRGLSGTAGVRTPAGVARGSREPAGSKGSGSG